MGKDDLPRDEHDTSQPEIGDHILSRGAAGDMDADQIGPYRLLQVLGEGGMGEVWLAEQKKPIHRKVAIKLIKVGMDTKAVIARFESERQALALMDHPNIARVFDAGCTAEGRPYFVMEYVPGLPITEYCDKHRLTMKDRLELFMEVCDGVQHAHQKAIIHRDLKPSNVLVVEQDNKAVPKVIDFGLAKATAQRLTDKTMFTELGVMMGTPEYMSPEQADQREQNIDTRTDVYSLGVILYQLLVGVLPFEEKALRAAGMEGILRVIREQEPPKPSTKIRSMGEASKASAEKRREEPQSFARHLQGELDWITMKALEKDRTRRYGTPSELSADVSRYLRGEAVVAGPTTTGYRVQKFAARHRIGLVAAATSLILLIGFVVTQTVELRQITRERDRANRERDRASRERDRATRIASFMTGIFKVSDPGEARGNTITAREVLDKASMAIDTSLAEDPELQAQMMSVMGDVYDNLGLYPRAQLLQQHSTEIRQHVLGPENPETLRSMLALALTIEDQGHFSQAEALERQTLDVQRRVLGPDHPDTLNSMNNLANVLSEEGRYAEAETLYRETLPVRRRVLGPEHQDTLGSMNGLASDLQQEGHFAEAEALERQTLDVQRRVLGPDHPDTLNSMNNLATDLRLEGHYAEAEKLDRETLATRRRVLGPEHPVTLSSMSNLAAVLESEGHYAESKKLDLEALAICRRVLGPEHPDTLAVMNNLADTLTKMREYASAEKVLTQTLDIQRRVLGAESPDAAISTYNLGVVAAHQGRSNEAVSLLREAVDHGLPPDADLGMDTDPDLELLHQDPGFVAVVSHARERATLTKKPN
jgi:serine/threonine protein kinase/tetratricopeptide (TPR) repeat protein